MTLLKWILQQSFLSTIGLQLGIPTEKDNLLIYFSIYSMCLAFFPFIKDSIKGRVVE